MKRRRRRTPEELDIPTAAERNPTQFWSEQVIEAVQMERAGNQRQGWMSCTGCRFRERCTEWVKAHQPTVCEVWVYLDEQEGRRRQDSGARRFQLPEGWLSSTEDGWHRSTLRGRCGGSGSFWRSMRTIWSV